MAGERRPTINPARSDETVAPRRRRRLFLFSVIVVFAAVLIIGLTGVYIRDEGSLSLPSTAELPRPSPSIPVPVAPPVPEPETGGPPSGQGAPPPEPAWPAAPDTGGVPGAPAPPPGAVQPLRPGLPDFPWPPPTPSASQPLPGLLTQLGFITVGQVADWVAQSLDQRSYFDRSYHSAPNGFAMVTRLERINEDGTPFAGPDRWPVNVTSEGFSLIRYIEALFAAPEGHYRVIVFVVTSELLIPSGERPTEQYMLGLLSGGADRLPAIVRDAPLTPDHTCVALIYEFEQRGLQGQPALLVPGRLTGRDHLVAAGLW